MDNYSVHASVIEEVKTEDEDMESLHKDSKGVEVDLEGHEAAVGSLEPIAASRSLRGLAHPCLVMARINDINSYTREV